MLLKTEDMLRMFHTARIKQQIVDRLAAKQREVLQDIRSISSTIVLNASWQPGTLLLRTGETDIYENYPQNSLWQVSKVDLITPKPMDLKPRFQYMVDLVKGVWEADIIISKKPSHTDLHLNEEQQKQFVALKGQRLEDILRTLPRIKPKATDKE